MKFTSFIAGLFMTIASWFGYMPVQVAQTVQNAVPVIATSSEAASTTVEIVDAASSTLSNSSAQIAASASGAAVSTTSVPASVSTPTTAAIDPLAGLGSDKYADGILPLSGMGGMNMQTDNSNNMPTPPAAAISACANASAGGECSFTTPNGTISGTCQTPPAQSSLACVPSQ
jgi:hypothetical protein